MAMRPEYGPVEDDATRDLVRRARQDPSAGFPALYARVAPALFTWCALRILPPLRSRLDPADLVQEVCCRAWGAFDTFDAARAGFRGWIFGIAKNVLRESLERLHRGGDRPGAGAEVAGDVPADATSISRRVARDESVRGFVEHLGDLADEERSLLIYRGLEGLTLGDAAQRLGISTAAAEKRWQRLTARLEPMAPPPDLLSR